MRCNICNKVLEPKEIQFTKYKGTLEPCFQCKALSKSFETYGEFIEDLYQDLEKDLSSIKKEEKNAT